MVKPKLVSDWHRAWRWLSVQAMVLVTALQGVWLTLPEDWKSSVPSELISSVTIICLVLGTIGRLIQQKG